MTTGCLKAVSVDTFFQKRAMRHYTKGPVPEKRRGAWKIYHVQHDLLPEGRRILRITDGDRDASYNDGDKDATYLSGKIRDMEGEVMSVHFGEFDKFRIDKVDRHEKMTESDASVTLRLVIGANGSQVFLDALGWSEKSILIDEPDLTYEDAWGQLLEQNGIGTRYSDDGLLRVPYYDTSLKERISMKKNLDLEAELLGCEFERLQRTVRICPQSERDAELWACDLMKSEARDYLTPEQYDKLANAIRKKLPGFEITFADMAKHGDDHGQRTPEFWYVQAGEDWRLRPGTSRNKPDSYGWVENDEYHNRWVDRSEEISDIIRGADDVVVVSSPVLDHECARNIDASGARCYVITSTMERLRKEPRRRLAQDTCRIHEEATGEISKTALIRFSDGFGPKVVLADPESDGRRGGFLTSDLVSESMQCGQFLHVPLEPAEIREMWSLLKWGFWERATCEVVGETPKRCKPLGKFKPPKPVRILRSTPGSRRHTKQGNGNS